MCLQFPCVPLPAGQLHFAPQTSEVLTEILICILQIRSFFISGKQLHVIVHTKSCWLLIIIFCTWPSLNSLYPPVLKFFQSSALIQSFSFLAINVYLNNIGRMDDFLVDGKPLNTLKVVELKEWLHKRGVKIGKKKKADLILR